MRIILISTIKIFLDLAHTSGKSFATKDNTTNKSFYVTPFQHFSLLQCPLNR
jgi:hypothetical protein